MQPPGPARKESPISACSPAVLARNCCCPLVRGGYSCPSQASTGPGYHAWARGSRGETAAGSHGGASGLSACEGKVCRVGGWPCRRTAFFHCCLCLLALLLASCSPLRTGGRRRRRRTLRAGAALMTGPRGVRTSRLRLALAGHPCFARRGEVWVHLPGPASCWWPLRELLSSTL